MKKFFLIKVIAALILILLEFSCETSGLKLKEFNNYKNKIKPEVFNDFPINSKNFESPYILTTVNPSIVKRGYSGIFITYKFDNRVKLNMHLSKLNFNKEKIPNQNYLVIPDSLTKQGFISETKKNLMPVPSLNDPYNYLNNIINPEKCSFFIFDNNEGEFYNKPFDLPTEEYIYTGFSNGLVIDEENYLVTYWVMVW